MPDPQVLKIPTIDDDRGEIGVIDLGFLPFPIARVYYLFDVTTQSVRGAHAHKTLTQFLVATSGSFCVELNDGLGRTRTFTLRTPREGLLIPPGYWRHLHDFSSGSVCLVLASDRYRREDYIRSFPAFVAWKEKG